MRLMYRKKVWYLAGLPGLFVLFYYGVSNEAFITKHQSVDNKGADVVSVVKQHQAENALHEEMPAMNEDARFIDYGDGER